MPFIKRTMLIVFTGMMCFSGTAITHAQTNEDSLQDAKSKLEESKKQVAEKEQEKQSVNGDIESIKTELESLHNSISENEKELKEITSEIKSTEALIEKKKEEIIKLEDKVLARKDIMEKRLVALQQSDQGNVVVKSVLDSENIGDFFGRYNAATTLAEADQDILQAQKDDLKQIEEDKKTIDKQEKVLKEKQESLSESQASLQEDSAKREGILTDLQAKYGDIVKDLDLSQKEQSSLEAQMQKIEDSIKKEQEAAAAAKEAEAKKAAEQQAAEEEEAKAVTQPEVVKEQEPQQQPVVKAEKAPEVKKPAQTEDKGSEPESGKVLYVQATAYSYEETNANGGLTATGLNIKTDPNMKLIAVDPNVIPLGSKVWVEGYGVAVAGDTGGAIKGHIIDVLQPSKSAALAWGRKNIKVKILN
ncbi:3D domain-containing protein [Priestia endophytica]|uniref:3D domain-containing protein n=1 Tax=Priestia endophytica TaxID=135735 RepID=UPI002E1BA37E|nr:3D domain-containing protein [Priestia endophytica]MED4071655.1 3D domain-containing protein [Priestia endophytica]